MMLYTNYLHNILIIVIVNIVSFYIKAHIIIISIHQKNQHSKYEAHQNPYKNNFRSIKD